MVETIIKAGEALGIARESPDGSERLSGHSLRVTGAQGLAAMGWHLWAVQLQGRWGSDTIKKYLREAPLAHPSPTPSAALDIDALVEKLLPVLSHQDRQQQEHHCQASTPSIAQSEQMEELLAEQSVRTVRSSATSSSSSDLPLKPAELVN